MSSTKENAPPQKRTFFSFLRHPFKPKPVQTAEFKHPVPCRKAPCPVCPPGESRNGKGACGPPVNNECLAGQSWNGGACVAAASCPAGTYWSGVACDANGDRCASYNAQAAMQSNGLRGIKNEMDRVCLQDPNGQQCRELTQQHDGQLLRYRGLLNEAPVNCRGVLPDPLSL